MSITKLKLPARFPNNAIESLNSVFHRFNRCGTVFPNFMVLTRAFNMVTWEMTKNGPCPIWLVLVYGITKHRMETQANSTKTLQAIDEKPGDLIKYA